MDLDQEVSKRLQTSYMGFLVASIAVTAVVKATVEFIMLKAPVQMIEYLNLRPAYS